MVIGLLFTAGLPVRAALTLPRVFGDHMVLQAEQPVPIWGQAEEGARVTVRFAGRTQEAQADAQGRWRVVLEPLAPSRTPAELIVEADRRITFTDVLVGEVWLCSGQSNMEKPLGEQPGQQPVFDAAEEIRSADYPDIRLFKVKRNRASAAGVDVEGAWVRCRPENIDAMKFSAAGYFFGRRVHRETSRAVGLIDSTWGGTRIEVWIAPAAFAGVGALEPFARALQHPGTLVERIEPASLYHGMIAPLAPFALKGALWYQGESNVHVGDSATEYADKMVALVDGWRGAWQREFGFYFVQLAPHLYHVARPDRVVSPETAAELREGQAIAAARIARSGLVVTTDLVDDLMDIHPRNKKDVGERLASWALAREYGRTDIQVSGPVFRRMETAGDKVILHFAHAEGLRTSDGKPPSWFAIAGEDRNFQPAIAAIEGTTVVVRSPKVSAPAVVRFGWDEAARPNLINGAGLPALPFRTERPRAP